MKLNDALAMPAVKGLGGTGDLEAVTEALQGCNEAHIILYKDGKPTGVLLYSSDGSEASVNRAVETATRLSA